MYKIFINSTQRNNKKVSLVKFEKQKQTIIEEVSGEIDMIYTISEILGKNKIDVDEIDEIVPILGPGSFTGLKMGVTIANVFNWSSGKISEKNILLPEYGAEPNIQPKN